MDATNYRAQIAQDFCAKKMAVPTDEIGAIVRHRAAPLDEAGAQHSLSPIKANGGAVIMQPIPHYERIATQFRTQQALATRG